MGLSFLCVGALRFIKSGSKGNNRKAAIFRTVAVPQGVSGFGLPPCLKWLTWDKLTFLHVSLVPPSDIGFW